MQRSSFVLLSVVFKLVIEKLSGWYLVFKPGNLNLNSLFEQQLFSFFTLLYLFAWNKPHTFLFHTEDQIMVLWFLDFQSHIKDLAFYSWSHASFLKLNWSFNIGMCLFNGLCLYITNFKVKRLHNHTSSNLLYIHSPLLLHSINCYQVIVLSQQHQPVLTAMKLSIKHSYSQIKS